MPPEPPGPPRPHGPPAPIPAATVVVARDGERGLEVLLLRRDRNLAFAGGAWVFPGGRVDDEDRAGLAPGDTEGAARRAAVREAAEEAGAVLDPSDLVWFAHWTPPPISPKRFATYFFLVTAPGGLEVVVDDGEIREHAWMRPSDAQARRNAGEIELHPPTWITLSYLGGFATVADALTHGREHPAEYFETRFASVDGGGVALYHGDVAYDDVDPTSGEVRGDPGRPGDRHRLWMVADGWRYERDPS